MFKAVILFDHGFFVVVVENGTLFLHLMLCISFELDGKVKLPKTKEVDRELTVKERLIAIRLVERIRRNPEYANQIGLKVIRRGTDVSNHKTSENGQLFYGG